MKQRLISLRSLFVFTAGLLLVSSCQRSQPTDPQQSSPSQSAAAVPPDLQETVDRLVRAAETFDIPHLLDTYAEDFLSGTGRTKDDIREVFNQLRKNNVKLKVEKTELESIESETASLRTQFRLRYMDHFRDLGEGEVVITDILRHALRKENGGWKIHADERLFTYREGRFGAHPPNVQLDVPDRLPFNLEYVVTVTVRQESETEYQVMVGTYVEAPAILPPPDIVTSPPEDGILRVSLLP
ncbi:MAG: hypothetical protein AB7P69_27885, partial [Candidatus Binatia bacterium]